MSWAAHDLEPYVIQRELGRRVAFVPLLAGSYAPDMTSKWFVYGINLFGLELKADNPAQFHRGWPGVGFTHSLAYGVVIGLLLYLIWRNEVVAYSFVIGQWAQYLLPLVLMTDRDKYVLTQGIAQISVNAGYEADWSGLFAALSMSILPMIIVYAFFQRQIQAGLTAGAVK